MYNRREPIVVAFLHYVAYKTEFWLSSSPKSFIAVLKLHLLYSDTSFYLDTQISLHRYCKYVYAIKFSYLRLGYVLSQDKRTNYKNCINLLPDPQIHNVASVCTDVRLFKTCYTSVQIVSSALYGLVMLQCCCNITTLICEPYG